MTALGESGLSLDPNSIRVVEYSASDNLIGEVASQFDQAAGYDPATNAAGTVVWIMSGTTPASTSRYYYVYFDSTDTTQDRAGLYNGPGLEWQHHYPIEHNHSGNPQFRLK